MSRSTHAPLGSEKVRWVRAAFLLSLASYYFGPSPLQSPDISMLIGDAF